MKKTYILRIFSLAMVALMSVTTLAQGFNLNDYLYGYGNSPTGTQTQTYTSPNQSSYGYPNQYPQQYPSTQLQCTQLSSVLRLGSRDVYTQYGTSNQVTQLQIFLNATGYLNTAPTGYFGSMTRAALVNFQRANRISPSGTTNPLTRSAIRNISCQGNTNPGYPTYPPYPTAQPTISQPSGSETYTSGDRINITISNPQNTTYTVQAVGEYGSTYELGSLQTQSNNAWYYGTVQLPVSIPGGRFKLRLTPPCPVLNGSPYNCSIVESNYFYINTSNTNPNSGSFKVYLSGSSYAYQAGNSIAFYWTNPTGVTAGSLAAYLENSNGQTVDFQYLRPYDTSSSMTIPTNTPAGSYRISVKNTSGSSNPIVGYSDYFTVSSNNNTPMGTIRVLTPNGGERWEMGKSYYISWTAAVNSADRVNVKLEKTVEVCTMQYPNYDCPTTYTLATNIQNQGYLYWTPTLSLLSDFNQRALATGEYRIRVSAANNSNITDTSDAPFSIINGASTGQGLSIVNPVYGTMWPLGTTQQVRYSASSFPSGAVAVISLSGNSGSGVVKTTTLPTNGVIDVPLTYITVGGDAVANLQPGTYTLTMDIYDRTPCLGMCVQGYPAAQKLSTASVSQVTIYR